MSGAMLSMEEMEKRIQYLAAQQAAATGRDSVSTTEIVSDIVRHAPRACLLTSLFAPAGLVTTDGPALLTLQLVLRGGSRLSNDKIAA